MNDYNDYRPPRNDPSNPRDSGEGDVPAEEQPSPPSPAPPAGEHQTMYFSGEPTPTPTPPPAQGGYGGYDDAAYYNVPDTTMLLVWSILVMLCCCQPLGIVAIVFAALAKGAADAGNYAEAMEKAEKAKMFCWIGFGGGLLVWLGYFGFVMLMTVAGA